MHKKQFTNKKEMNYIGKYNNLSNAFVILILCFSLPVFIKASLNIRIVIFTFMIFGWFLYVVNYIYSIKMQGDKITKHFFIFRKNKFYQVNKENIRKVIIALPAVKSYPLVRIYFEESSNEEIWFSTRDSKNLRNLYYFFREKNINCEVIPDTGKKSIGILDND